MSQDPADRHPLVIDSRDLPRQPGASRRVTAEVAGEAWGNEVARIGDEPTTVSLLLESVLDGILVTGESQVSLRGECARCLDPLDTTLPVTFRQFFTYPGVDVPPGEDSDDDVVPMSGPLLDLRPAFRDAAVLALPLNPLCRPDCPGLCPECGARLADDPDHHHDHSDTRLAALGEWRARLTEPDDGEGRGE